MSGIELSIEVRAPVSECFELLSHAENYPKFVDRILHVSEKEGGGWHWMARGTFGRTFEWDSRMVQVVPGISISWTSSLEAAIEHSGTLDFEALEEGTCRITLNMTYSLPGGPVGEFFMDIFGSLDFHLRDSLKNFKSMAEDRCMRQSILSQAPITSQMHDGYIYH